MDCWEPYCQVQCNYISFYKQSYPFLKQQIGKCSTDKCKWEDKDELLDKLQDDKTMLVNPIKGQQD